MRRLADLKLSFSLHNSSFWIWVRQAVIDDEVGGVAGRGVIRCHLYRVRNLKKEQN